MPAATSKRVLWKGAISFGLVHIPIALHSAIQNQSIDFDWLDRRSMEPVGYKRINKVTGEDIERADIVKGIQQAEGEYVVLETDEIASAYPRTTQTVEIEAFVSLDDIPFVYLERPYYVAPINKGGKVYGLLREVLAESRLAGLAKVVIQTKQHLALLFACGPVLILNLLRWGDEVRDWSALNLPDQDKKSLGLSEKELDMARQLVSELTIDWQPDRFTDTFREQIMQLVQEKIDAGETTQVTQPEPEEEEGGSTGGARIYDLTEMLQRSLKGRGKAKSSSASTEEESESTDDEAPEPRSRAAKRSSSTKKASSAKKASSIKKTTPAKKTATAKKSGSAKKTTTTKASSKSSKSATRSTPAAKKSAAKKTSTTAKRSSSNKRRAA